MTCWPQQELRLQAVVADYGGCHREDEADGHDGSIGSILHTVSGNGQGIDARGSVRQKILADRGGGRTAR